MNIYLTKREKELQKANEAGFRAFSWRETLPEEYKDDAGLAAAWQGGWQRARSNNNDWWW